MNGVGSRRGKCDGVAATEADAPELGVGVVRLTLDDLFRIFSGEGAVVETEAGPVTLVRAG